MENHQPTTTTVTTDDHHEVTGSEIEEMLNSLVDDALVAHPIIPDIITYDSTTTSDTINQGECNIGDQSKMEDHQPITITITTDEDYETATVIEEIVRSLVDETLAAHPTVPDIITHDSTTTDDPINEEEYNIGDQGKIEDHQPVTTTTTTTDDDYEVASVIEEIVRRLVDDTLAAYPTIPTIITHDPIIHDPTVHDPTSSDTTPHEPTTHDPTNEGESNVVEEILQDLTDEVVTWDTNREALEEEKATENILKHLIDGAVTSTYQEKAPVSAQGSTLSDLLAHFSTKDEGRVPQIDLCCDDDESNDESQSFAKALKLRDTTTTTTKKETKRSEGGRSKSRNANATTSLSLPSSPTASSQLPIVNFIEHGDDDDSNNNSSQDLTTSAVFPTQSSSPNEAPTTTTTTTTVTTAKPQQQDETAENSNGETIVAKIQQHRLGINFPSHAFNKIQRDRYDRSISPRSSSLSVLENSPSPCPSPDPARNPKRPSNGPGRGGQRLQKDKVIDLTLDSDSDSDSSSSSSSSSSSEEDAPHPHTSAQQKNQRRPTTGINSNGKRALPPKGKGNDDDQNEDNQPNRKKPKTTATTAAASRRPAARPVLANQRRAGGRGRGRGGSIGGMGRIAAAIAAANARSRRSGGKQWRF